MNSPIILILLFLSLLQNTPEKNITQVKAQTTLTVLELNHGESIEYQLKNGRIVEFELLSSHTSIVFSTLDTLKKGEPGGGTIYQMTAKVRIDGQTMDMIRYVPVQESFYEPYVVNGLRIWFDGLRSPSQFFNETHGDCLPLKHARFAFQDASATIAPDTLHNWVAIPHKQLLIRDAYAGDDAWMGTYFGADLHGGLDINMPSTTPLWAPFDIDDHYLFNSVSAGERNNRWRGVRMWDNGDIWQIQTHHLVELTVPEHQPLQKGQHYANAGGVWAGDIPHTHFVWRVKHPGRDWTFMDPWVLFWQMFQHNKEKSGAINAHIKPVQPATTGKTLQFRSEGSRPGIWGSGSLTYHWDFGDGYTSNRANPIHTFYKQGIHPVTLTVCDGQHQAVYTQHISVNGTATDLKRFHMKVKDNPSFIPTSPNKTRAYGSIPRSKNHIIFYGYDRQREHFSPQTISIIPHNFTWTELPKRAYRIDISYVHGNQWLQLETSYEKESIEITLTPQIDKLINRWGVFEAYLIIHHHDAINSPQQVRITVEFAKDTPKKEVVIDNAGNACEISPFFWLAPEIHAPWAKGYSEKFYIQKSSDETEYIRYRPTLEEGIYRVELLSPAYQNDKIIRQLGGFYVNVKHRHSNEKIWIEPNKSLVIGEFEFKKGREGYVEIIPQQAHGLILTDAVKFTIIEEETF